MNLNAAPFETIHGDVLHAKPEDDDGKRRLIEEVRNRGNAAFKAKRFEESIALYSKAIEIDPEGENTHTLYGNRSAARCAIGKLDEALGDARAATTLSPSWAKGYFREAQALSKLGRHDEACNALESALEKDPSSTAVQKMLSTEEELAKTVGSEKAKPSSQTQQRPPPSSFGANAPSSTTVPSSPSIAAPSSSGTDVVSQAEEDEENLKDVRGYRKLADGRVTTYFNKELSEEEKALIGDITPKKVETTNMPPPQQKPGGGSAWNMAGTYEERDLTKWAKDRLCAILNEVGSVSSPTGEAQVTEVIDCDGEASISIIRGTKRYIFDLRCTVNVSLSGDQGEAKGAIKLLEVSNDCEDDFEWETSLSSSSSQAAGEGLRALMRRGGALNASVMEAVRTFVQEFKSK